MCSHVNMVFYAVLTYKYFLNQMIMPKKMRRLKMWHLLCFASPVTTTHRNLWSAPQVTTTAQEYLWLSSEGATLKQSTASQATYSKPKTAVLHFTATYRHQMCISQDHAALNGTICKRSAIWFKYFDVIIYLLTSCWTLLLQKIYLSTSGTCTTSLFYFIFLYPFIFLYILFTTTLKDRPQRATSSTLVSWFTPRNHFRFVHGTAVKSTCCGNSRPAVPPKRVSQTLGTFRWNGALQHITTGLCSTSQQGFAAHRRLCNTSQHQTHTGWQHDTAEQKMGAMPNASRVRTGASPQRIREHPLRNKHSTEQKTHIQQQPLLAGAHHHRQDQSTNTHTLRNKHSTEHTHKGTSTAQNTHTDGQAQHKKSNYVQGSWTEKVSRAPSTGMD